VDPQARECAKLRLTAKPNVNAQTAPYETIRSKVASCASARETVTLVQHTGAFGRKTWTITLAPGQRVDKVRHIPYSCCGSYTITDRVLSSSGRVIARAQAGFTFA